MLLAGFAIVRTIKNKPNWIFFAWCATGIPQKKSWTAFQVQLLLTTSAIYMMQNAVKHF